MSIFELLSNLLVLIGAVFFLAGTIGLVRFPDVYTRLHALTKVDNLGLGFTVMGLLIQAPGTFAALKLMLIWLLAMLASATANFLIVQRAFARGIVPWEAMEGES